jgi:hypothetical protein
MNLSRLLLTRLVLPFLLVAGIIAIPFIWLPDYEKTSNRSMEISLPKSPSSANSENHENNSPPNTREGDTHRKNPFQKAMTLGFGLLLVSVTCGGMMLYGITRRQTIGWRRRFAPKKKKKNHPIR